MFLINKEGPHSFEHAVSTFSTQDKVRLSNLNSYFTTCIKIILDQPERNLGDFIWMFTILISDFFPLGRGRGGGGGGELKGEWEGGGGGGGVYK